MTKAIQTTIIASWLALAVCLLPTASAAGAEVARTSLRVANLYCGACLTQIDAALNQDPAFIALRGQLPQGIVQVDHRPALTAAEIASRISALGYPATVLATAAADAAAPLAAGPQSCGGPRGCGTAAPGARSGTGVNPPKYGCGASAAAWKRLFGWFPKADAPAP